MTTARHTLAGPAVGEMLVGAVERVTFHNAETGFLKLHIFIDFGQLCSSKPTGRVHGNRTAVFMISTTCFQAGQHP